MPASSSPPLSDLTLGTAQAGLPYGLANRAGMPDEACAARIFDVAWAQGIRWFDTARAYGEAEARLGRWHGGMPGMVTKIPALPTGHDAAEWVAVNIAESSRALAPHRIDLLLLHRASDILLTGCRAALERARDEGQIGGYGISAYEPADIHRALKQGMLDAVQIPLNLADRRMLEDDLTLRLAESGCKVFARSAYLQGLLLMAPETLPAAFAVAAPVLDELRGLARAEDLPMTSLALGAVSGMPGIGSVVIGAEMPEQIDAAVAALAQADLPKPLLKRAVEIAARLPAWAKSPAAWPKS